LRLFHHACTCVITGSITRWQIIRYATLMSAS
jgi:hypothetical protein